MMSFLNGQLIFRPGRLEEGAANIMNTRTALAANLLRGQPAQSAPEQLARLYSLCGVSHRLTAQHAIDSASGWYKPANQQNRTLLTLETAREHIRRIWLDWPRLIGGTGLQQQASELQSLRDCPLLQTHEAPLFDVVLASSKTWIENKVLGQSARTWLDKWHDSPIQCLQAWVAQADTFPANLLREIEFEACRIQAVDPGLMVHREQTSMRDIAYDIERESSFQHQPYVQQHTRETGSWQRSYNLDSKHGFPSSNWNLWIRMGARIAELIQLCDVNPLTLEQGALSIRPGVAIAWSEMARGLLLHWVKLDQNNSSAKIVDYRIVAPTEWNFHPNGVVARILSEMELKKNTTSKIEVERQIALLAAAFDPCVNYQIAYDGLAHA